MAAILLALPQCMESIGSALDTPRNAYMKAEDKKIMIFCKKVSKCFVDIKKSLTFALAIQRNSIKGCSIKE